MKKFGKKNIIVVCAVILALLVSSGVTLAYFSDYETAMGQATLNLSGKTEIEEHVTDKEKVISIKNTGEAGKNADVVTRVAIYGPDEMDVTAENGWTEKQSDGYYYYTGILAPQESTTNITASIENVPTTTDLSELEIIVVHESAPVSYDSNGRVQEPEGWDYIPAISAPAQGQ